jgi:hypothetical protein
MANLSNEEVAAKLSAAFGGTFRAIPDGRLGGNPLTPSGKQESVDLSTIRPPLRKGAGATGLGSSATNG